VRLRVLLNFNWQLSASFQAHVRLSDTMSHRDKQKPTSSPYQSAQVAKKEINGEKKLGKFLKTVKNRLTQDSKSVNLVKTNPLHAFPRNFAVDGEVANLLATSCCNGIWETIQRTDTTDFCPCQLVTGLLRTCLLCCGLVTGKLV